MEYRGFGDYLEQKARQMVSGSRRSDGYFAVSDHLEREIEFTLDQLNRIRHLRESQLKSLLKTECYVDTQLMQGNRYMSVYRGAYSGAMYSQHPDQNVLYQRLFSIESERRKQDVFHEGQIQGLRKKLLDLVQKHEQLNK